MKIRWLAWLCRLFPCSAPNIPDSEGLIPIVKIGVCSRCGQAVTKPWRLVP
jgi:hypothetical protein